MDADMAPSSIQQQILAELRALRENALTRDDLAPIYAELTKHEKLLNGNGREGLVVRVDRAEQEYAALTHQIASVLRSAQEATKLVTELSKSVEKHVSDQGCHNLRDMVLAKLTKSNIAIIIMVSLVAHAILETINFNVFNALLKWLGVSI